VFRYFDVFDQIGAFGILTGKTKITAWGAALAARSSVQTAVAPNYNARRWSFLQRRNSHLSMLMPVTGRDS
jgi:glutathione S-transferase